MFKTTTNTEIHKGNTRGNKNLKIKKRFIPCFDNGIDSILFLWADLTMRSINTSRHLILTDNQ